MENIHLSSALIGFNYKHWTYLYLRPSLATFNHMKIFFGEWRLYIYLRPLLDTTINIWTLTQSLYHNFICFMFQSNSMELWTSEQQAHTAVDWYDSSRMIYLVWSATSTKRHLAGIFELRVVCLSANPSVCRKTCQYRAYLALLSNRLRTNVVERKKLAVKKYPRICSQRPRNIERWNLLNISQILSFHIISLLKFKSDIYRIPKYFQIPLPLLCRLQTW